MKKPKLKLLFTAIVALSAAFLLQSVQGKAEVPEPNYLTFEAREDDVIIWWGGWETPKSSNIKYSVNNGESWADFPADAKYTLKKGFSIRLKGEGVTSYSNGGGSEERHFFTDGDGKLYASGSVTSLLDGNGAKTDTVIPVEGFNGMFRDCYNLVTAPELPSTNLSDGCYKDMFCNCTGLVTPMKELPATSLCFECYSCMFMGCGSLQSAPEIKATQMAYRSCIYMFNECSSLEKAPTLNALSLDTECYKGMFQKCSTLKKAPDLPAETLAKSCYEMMFRNCTSLETVPVLSATTPAPQCYVEMFENCNYLLIAKTPIADMDITAEWSIPNSEPDNYHLMFDGASIFTSIPEDQMMDSTPTGGTYYIYTLYKVKINSDIKNGTVTADALENIKHGETVSLTVTPNSGYRLDKLTVKDGNGNLITVTSDFKFTMPGSDVTVEAVFEAQSKPTPGPKPKFKDVPADKWYAKENGPIDYVVSNGIMNGISSDTFEPESPCTREMFVQIIYNVEGSPACDKPNPFEDVKPGKWYYKSVVWAVNNKITSGKSATEFGVGENVTREQLAQFLMNYANKCAFDTTARADISKFPDAGEVSGWAKNAISWANANGIINGKAIKGTNYLAPKGNATRAETAQMIMAFMKKFGR